MINFESFNGGSIASGQLIKAYVNLKNGKIAIRDKKGKVQGYCEEITLIDAHFQLSQKTLERVRRDKSKEVFAYCIGTYEDMKTNNAQAVSFNPFSEVDSFYYCDTLEPIDQSEIFKTVTLKNKKAYV
jgi:hypothetical protein